MRPSATRARPSGESRIWRTVHRTLPSTARDNCSSGESLRIEIGKAGDDARQEQLNPRTKLLSLVLGRQRRADRPASLMAEYHEQRRLQIRPRVLQAPRNLRREDVAGHADHEQFSQAGIENPLGRHARIAATEDRRVGSLGLGEIGQRLPPEGGTARLAPEKPLIPLDQPSQRLIGGGSGVFRRWSHGERPFGRRVEREKVDTPQLPARGPAGHIPATSPSRGAVMVDRHDDGQE